MVRALVTGANRGIGLALTRALLARGDRVIAACRKPGQAHELTKLALAHPGHVHVLPLEVTKPASAAELAREAALVTDALDLLINNAGVLPAGERYGSWDSKSLIDCFAVNVGGPVALTQALAALLARGASPKVVNMSSILGSIARREQFDAPSYAVSKAALNMASRLMAHALAPQGIAVLALHPGWVRTDMGGAKAEIAPEDSVRGMLAVIDAFTLARSGAFLSWQGETLPW
jgi:NAD(P)-dependent dehydrogenase (short-subunit alcohol dehydrogenase family)